MPANYPTADPSFSAKSAGQKIQASHINTLQDETIAIGAALRGTLPHNITTAGTLTLGQGQIVFPGIQVPSANANTLDDYREDTFTPVFTSTGGASGQIYAVQSGLYVKVGRQVTIVGHVRLSTLGTFTGDLQIGGFPFPFAAAAAGQAVVVSFFVNFTAPAIASMSAFGNQGTSAATLYVVVGGGSLTPVPISQANISASFDVTFSSTYLTDN